MVLGAVVFVVGLILSWTGRIPGLGRLPGDIVYERGGFRLYFPIVTCLLLSLILTLLLFLFRK